MVRNTPHGHTLDQQLDAILRRRGYSSAEERGQEILDTDVTVSGANARRSARKAGNKANPDLREFQQFYNLKPTGRFDPATKEILTASRCGVPDPVGPSSLRTDNVGWGRRSISLSIDAEMPGYDNDLVRQRITQACSIWEHAGDLDLGIVAAGGDIRLSFGRHRHGDGFPFDGIAGELAHAFFPDYQPRHFAGQVHFDMSENWSMTENCPDQAKDFLSVAIHEIGHALGIDHVGIRGSVMFANYQGVQRNLYAYDIEAIKEIYL